MTAEELWKKSGLTGKYDVWSFGDKADELTALVKNGIKTATCSALVFYELENEPLPQVGNLSIILDSNNNAVCIIKTSKVYVTTFDSVTKEHAYKEGEGDRSLKYWQKVHKEFFTKELAQINQKFDKKMKLVCEEFCSIF